MGVLILGVRFELEGVVVRRIWEYSLRRPSVSRVIGIKIKQKELHAIF